MEVIQVMEFMKCLAVTSSLSCGLINIHVVTGNKPAYICRSAKSEPSDRISISGYVLSTIWYE